jgi:hypothetical protein
MVSFQITCVTSTIYDSLSARIEPAWLGHLVSVFLLGAEVPYECGDAEDGKTKDGGVGFPVGGLSVPATSR